MQSARSILSPVESQSKILNVDLSRSRRQLLGDILLFFAVLIATGLPRSLDLDRFATPDERLWLARSANFYFALGQLDFASTFQREHPGVTTMWAGTAGFLWRYPQYRGSGLGQLEFAALERYFDNNELGVSALDLLAAGRMVMVWGNTLILALAFLYARRLLGTFPALLGFFLIALDPFHIAHTRLLHLDGLLSSLMLLSLIAFLGYLRSKLYRDLLVSAVAAGLSWLTKSPGMFLLPVIGLLASADLAISIRSTRSFNPSAVRKWMVAGALWSVAAVLVFGLFWPAMWVEPLGSLSRVFGAATGYFEEGHGDAVYFDGEIFLDGKIGADRLDFYALNYLWRSTPVVLLGLGLFTLVYFFQRDWLAEKDMLRTTGGMLLLTAVYFIVLTAGGKKFDRYLLPAFPALDLVAAIGWYGLAKGLARRFSLGWWVFPLLIIFVVTAQALVALPNRPYYLSYYNPLLGGGQQALSTLQIGWGEGLDQAARYLNQKPDLGNLDVISWYAEGPFSLFFEGRSSPINVSREIKEYQWDRYLNADYAVIYVHQWQREMPAALLDCLAEHRPEHRIWLNGIEYVRIYNFREIPLETCRE